MDRLAGLVAGIQVMHRPTMFRAAPETAGQLDAAAVRGEVEMVIPIQLKLILQGFSEAAMAAHAIHPIVFPDVALHFEYSTTKGVPG